MINAVYMRLCIILRIADNYCYGAGISLLWQVTAVW